MAVLSLLFGDGEPSATIPSQARVARILCSQLSPKNLVIGQGCYMSTSCLGYSTRIAVSLQSVLPVKPATAKRYSGRSGGMFGSHACSATSPLAEPSFWVELSPCTGGDSGGQSLGDVGRIGGHAGRRARVARRMVAEGSRSRTIILRITQQTYLTFGDSYWTYNLFITARPHHCHCACCRR